MALKRVFWLVGLTASSAVLLYLAFPPVAFGWLAWGALAPLVLALRAVPRPRYGWALGLLWGAVFYGVLLWWMQQFVQRWTGTFWLGLVAWAALVLSQSLFAGLFGWAYTLWNGRARGAGLPIGWAVALWGAVEWLRGAGDWGFLWGQLAVSQYRNLLPLQTAELLGAWGLSAWIFAVNVAIAEAFANRRLRPILGVAEVSLLLLLFGWWRLQASIAPSEQIAVLVAQPNVDTTQTRSLTVYAQIQQRFRHATALAIEQGVDLLLLPESLLPDVSVEPYRPLIERANRQGVTILTGAFEQHGEDHYNTVAAVSSDRGVERYRKQHLVPWGEYVPFRRWTPWVERFGVVSRDTLRGQGPTLLTRWQVGTPICFESTLPRIAGQMAREGARLLCVVTNDTWFQRSPAAEQHLAFCALRAVETRRWVLRSATTGISAVFDEKGRSLQRAELFEESYLKAEGVPLLRTQTVYVRLGDTGAILSLLLGGLLVGWLSYRRR